MPVNSFDDYPMSWRPELKQVEVPKYIALANLLEADVKSGVLKPGTKLPPQRELADFLDVNLSTISRAFKLCEQKGLICAAVGNGTFIASDVKEEKMLLYHGSDELIEMGAILPGTDMNKKVKLQLEKLLSRPEALQLFSYGLPEAEEGQKRAGVEWLKRTGFVTDGQHIVLAAGGQNALLASLGAFFKRGDRVGTDPATYPGIKSAANFLGIHLIPVQTQNYEMTEEGIRYAVQNENIKGIYVIPDYHNPTSHIMSRSTRQMIARVAKELDILVIEDGINSMLLSEPVSPIASFAPEQVIYLSSLSKTISAGLRVAYVHVPLNRYQELVTALYSMNVAISPMMANLSKELILSGVADEIVAQRKQDIRERNLIVNEILKDFVIDGDLTCPLRWVHLPDYFSGKSFEICAKEAGVHVYGVERFLVGNTQAEKRVRISITTPATIGKLREGAKRLYGILRQREEIAFVN